MLSFISDIFYPDDDICKYSKFDFIMTIYIFLVQCLYFMKELFVKSRMTEAEFYFGM